MCLEKKITVGSFGAAVVHIVCVCSLSETRSQNTEKLSVDQAATVLFNFLQQARDGGERICSSRHTCGSHVWVITKGCSLEGVLHR